MPGAGATTNYLEWMLHRRQRRVMTVPMADIPCAKCCPKGKLDLRKF
jgi:hypothetical protein